MDTIDTAEFQQALAAMDATPPRPGTGFPEKQTVNARRATDKTLEVMFAKSGFDIKKLNVAGAQIRQAERAAFERRREEAASDTAATERAYREQVNMTKQAQAALAQPFTSTFVTLSEPLFITQEPRFEIRNFIDNHVEPFNSSIQYKVETNSDEDNTWFNFYFLWANDSSAPVVINATSPFVLNGNCAVGAATGVFDGDTALLTLVLSLNPLRWTGWGTDPNTGMSLDQTYMQTNLSTAARMPINLRAHGGGLFSSPPWITRTFSNQSIRLSFPMIVVPAHAVIIFNMRANFAYGFDGGGDVSDVVLIDFAGSDRMIRCPAVQLEVLTPVTRANASGVAGGATASSTRR